MTKANLLVSFPVTEDWQYGNHRSEARWELQACEALVESDKVTKVCTTKPIWNTDRSRPKKLQDNVDPDTYLLAQGFQPELEDLKVKGVVVNCYAHFSPEKMRTLVGKYKEKAVFTTAWVGDTLKEQQLASAVGDSHVEELPLPHIPQVNKDSPLNNKILLWVYRDLDYPNEVRPAIFEWVKQQLVNTNLEFHILTSSSKPIEEIFWAMDDSKLLTEVKDQIVLHPSLHWFEVLDLYKQTKLMVCPMSAGGAPIECAMYGIPHVSIGRNGPMQASPVVLEAPNVDIHLSHLDMLMQNDEYYTFIGETQREFVNKHYTYRNFTDRLTEITSKRGMG